MQETSQVIDCYDKTARVYGAKFSDELAHKHLDRLLLTAFAAENRQRGRLLDLGCGPGQTTAFLNNCGVQSIIGADISPQMIAVAREQNPPLEFEVADILSLPFADQTFGAAVAFYAIVHFDFEQLKQAFTEISRVLMSGGEFLFSFHIGDQTVHLDEFLDKPVNIDFYFFEPPKIIALLNETGFEIVDAIEREPYADAEYPSRRAYIWAKKKSR